MSNSLSSHRYLISLKPLPDVKSGFNWTCPNWVVDVEQIVSESPSGGSLHQRRQIFLHQEGPVLIEQSKEGGSSRSTLEPEEDWSGVRIKLEQWWISIWCYKTFFAWILENLSIQYTALGFEPTPFRPWVFPLTTRPGQVFTASVFGNHSTRLLPLPERTRRTGLSRT